MPDIRQHFFLKLNPCRPTFAMDMTADERVVMEQHVSYWRNQMAQGHVVIFGPVMDPNGPYGMGVIAAEDEAEVRAFIADDPASRINHYEFFAMRAVLPN